MGLKISRGIWFVSVLGMLAAFLFVYASLPDDVLVMQEDSTVYVGREGFFYAGLAIVTLVNAMVFMIGSVYRPNIPMRIWFNGLVTALNIFFVIAFLLINAVNSNEKFDFGRIGFMIYGSLVLVVVWAISWPVYLLTRKISGKATI